MTRLGFNTPTVNKPRALVGDMADSPPEAPPPCLDRRRWVGRCEVRKCDSFGFVLFQDSFGSFGSFAFHYRF